MNIQSKFKSGEEVYYIRPETICRQTNIVCPACRGKSNIEIDGEKLDCRSRFIHNGGHFECRFGTLWQCDYKWTASKYNYDIVRVTVEEEDGDVEITYLLDNGAEYSEEHCFATKEEAQAACDLRNKKVEMDNK